MHFLRHHRNSYLEDWSGPEPPKCKICGKDAYSGLYELWRQGKEIEGLCEYHWNIHLRKEKLEKLEKLKNERI